MDSTLNNNDNTYDAEQDFYNVKIKKVEALDTAEWAISGTTKAPDDARILAIVNKKDENYPSTGNRQIAVDGDHLPKVKNGRFKMTIGAMYAMSRDNIANGAELKVKLVASTLYDKKYNDELSSKWYKLIFKNGCSTVLSLNQKQVDYVSNADKSKSKDYEESNNSNGIETDSSSISENTQTSERVDPASFNRYFKNYIGKDVTITGKVLKIEKDGGSGYFLTLTDSNNQNSVAVGVSIDVMETLSDVTLQEGDNVTIDGSAVTGYTNTSISDSKKDMPGIDATEIQITSNYW